MRNLMLLALLPVLAACGANPAALAPTAPPAPVEALTAAPAAAATAAELSAAVILAPTAAPSAPPASPAAEPSVATTLASTAAPSAPVAATESSAATTLASTAVPSTVVGAAAPSAAPTTAPMPVTKAVASSAEALEPVRLVIPAIGVDRELVSVGLDRNRVPVVPNHDVGWYNLSARPGEGENIVLWGHVLRFKATPKTPAPFARLKELAVGAPLTLYDGDGNAYRYVVVEKVWATPDEVDYILPQGRELLTLVSCIGDKVVADGNVEMTHRLITIAAPAE